MESKLKIWTVCILLIANTPIVAQQNTNDTRQCKICAENSHTNDNPYDLSLKKEIPFIASSLAFLGTSILVTKSNHTKPYTVAELNTLNSNNINGFDRFASRNYSTSAQSMSNYIAFSSFAIPLLFLSEHYTRSDFFNLFAMGLEVGSTTIGITNTTKNIVNRPRPYTYNDKFPLDVRTNSQSKLSFFSGHTSITTSYSFFFAKVLTDYHPNMKKRLKVIVWSFAALVPATTAYLRVAAGKHYPTDVLTGYAVGALVGWLIPELHEKQKSSKLSIKMFNLRGANGVSLAWKL